MMVNNDGRGVSMYKAIVLAAGEGTRMKSATSKVLHTLVGKTMLQYVLESARCAVSDITVICGQNEASVRARYGDSVEIRRQPIGEGHPYGTGFAVLCGMDRVKDDDQVLVLTGDTPLIKGETLREFMEDHVESENVATVLTATIDDPTGYGRIVREGDQLRAIVEEKDCTDEERLIHEFNSGMFVFQGWALKKALEQLDTDNAQGELYLTDAIKILAADGHRVSAHLLSDVEEVYGINSKVQLAEAERVLRRRINESYMMQGAIMDYPDTVTIEDTVTIGRDTRIGANVRLLGNSIIGEEAVIGMNTVIVDSTIGDRVCIEQSVIEKSRVEEDVTIGPFAHLRPNAHLGKGVHIGNFVEVKNATLGAGTKAGHLAYIGDADLGGEINVGCGVIFVNYDGKRKHRTTVEDGAFIGSNANLVAPVHVESRGFIAAGSTVTKDVKSGALMIERSDQVQIEGWVKRKLQCENTGEKQTKK